MVARRPADSIQTHQLSGYVDAYDQPRWTSSSLATLNARESTAAVVSGPDATYIQEPRHHDSRRSHDDLTRRAAERDGVGLRAELACAAITTTA